MQFALTTVLALAATATAIGNRNDAILRARGDGEITCDNTDNVNGHREREAFVEGQEYLRGRGDECDTTASACERVSCSNNAAVYLCSADGKDHAGVSCPLIADYIDHIFDQCQEDGQWAVDMACGTQDNTDGWRVEVGQNSC